MLPEKSIGAICVDELSRGFQFHGGSGVSQRCSNCFGLGHHAILPAQQKAPLLWQGGREFVGTRHSAHKRVIRDGPKSIWGRKKVSGIENN
jgi:hypothetical protein